MTQLITISEAAKMLGVCADTLRVWDRDGKLPAMKTFGGHRRYRRADIKALLKPGLITWHWVNDFNAVTTGHDKGDKSLKPKEGR